MRRYFRDLSWIYATSALGLILVAGGADAAVSRDAHASHAHKPSVRERRHAPPLPPAAVKAAAAETLNVQANRVRTHGAEVAVSRATMDRFVAGTSPLQILSATTPGVSFASDDPFGLDTVANTLYVRGFNQDQIGATLDGIPMGDQGFQQYNGLDVNEAIIQDNLAGMTLSQGGGALDIPSTQNLGGALQFRSSDPDDKTGVRVSQVFGSNDTFRTFGRLDSGVLNRSGTKFYASYARTDNQKWKGFGDQLEQQANAKLVQPVGHAGTITALFDYSSFNQYNYLGIDMNMFRKLGQNIDYLYPNYSEAYAAAQGNYSSFYQKLGNASDEANATYLDGAQIQRNYLSGLIGAFDLTEHLHSRTVLYAHVSSGDYEAGEAVPGPDGSPLSQFAGHMGMRRIGLTEGLDYEIARHLIQTGVWYENNAFSFPGRFYAEPASPDAAPNSPLGPFLNPYATELNDQFNTNTFQYYLQDTYHILPNLRLSVGFRSVIQTTHGGAKENDPDLTGQTSLPDGDLTASNAFLPHVALNYEFLHHHELYIDIAENMRAYTYNPWIIGNGGAWSVGNQQQFDANKNTIRPERTWDYVVGYRYNSPIVSGSVDFYHVDYYNRLINTEAGSTVQPISTFANVGRESMNGTDVSATLRPMRGLEIFNSFSYNDAQYGSGFMYEGEYVNLRGKHQVAYPKFMYKVNATYTYRQARVTFNASYTARRPLSYENDVYVPAYWLASLSAHYDFGHVGFARHLALDFGIYNLFNTVYISGMGIGGFPVSGDYPTLFVGAPRQYFGTFSAQF